MTLYIRVTTITYDYIVDKTKKKVRKSRLGIEKKSIFFNENTCVCMRSYIWIGTRFFFLLSFFWIPVAHMCVCVCVWIVSYGGCPVLLCLCLSKNGSILCKWWLSRKKVDKRERVGESGRKKETQGQGQGLKIQSVVVVVVDLSFKAKLFWPKGNHFVT